MQNPCYIPVDPCCRDAPPVGSLSYTRAELEAMQSRQNQGPFCFTVQQPSRVGVRKLVTRKRKIIQEPQIMVNERMVQVPYITYIQKAVKVPKIINNVRIIKVPKIAYQNQVICEPTISCYKREVVEPKEVCQTLLCQPQPQTVGVPEPRDFCCYYGPIQNSAMPCPPCPTPAFSPYQTCGIQSACPPSIYPYPGCYQPMWASHCPNIYQSSY